ncbi:rhodanese-like domain-containing protein [uncultured Solobacterium sp.]|jgi:putative phage shock protein E|uniref:rhodanese-like domain-containing protein n=1 Tax=uncultured Solobacterium sp. TaxID=747375 RepID=UPI002605DC9C|nr:rhodanese-like domain-containing protein [uncultured Solobacterium sp.]
MKKLLILALSLFLAGCMITKTSETSSSYKTISSTEAQQMIEDNKDALILDVRTAAEYESGHIPNAVNLSNEDIQAGKVDSLKDKSQLIMVYCRSGNRSRQAAQKLAELGYTNVVDFGGIQSWQGDIEK